MQLRPMVFALTLAALTGAPGWTAPPPLDPGSGEGSVPAVVLKQSAPGGMVSLNLSAADAATISRTLGQALGGAVRIEGAALAPVTLTLNSIPVPAALDAVSKALNGKWRPVYMLTLGAAEAGSPRPLASGRTVTANLQDISARTALSLIARAAGGRTEMVGELPQTVSLKADRMPVEQALDEVARQVGGAWSVTYIIQAGAAPRVTPSSPPTPSAPATPSTPGTPRLNPGQPASRNSPPGLGFGPADLPRDVQTDPRFFPKPFEPRAQPPAAAPDSNAAKMLGEGLLRVMQMPPPQRQAAVKDFATQIDQQFRLMQNLPAARRSEQMAAMRPLHQAATRVFSGLTPDQRREFQPIMQVFSRWMR